jgi:hypothetical protein
MTDKNFVTAFATQFYYIWQHVLAFDVIHFQVIHV